MGGKRTVFSASAHGLNMNGRT